MKYFLAGLSIFLVSGCLDDRISPELNLQTESAIELLVYLESHGDYINSEVINEFVSASEVYANKNSYLIIDVRNEFDFLVGHIENAVNVEPKKLLEFINSKDLNNYSKIVIISESGQSAAYYTALLRIGGFTKVYSMEYGMAIWHQNFADIWLNATRDFRTGSNNFTNEDYPKPDPANLPKLSFENSNKSAKEKIEERINILLAAGFNEKLSDSSDILKFNSNTLDDGQASIVVETVYRHYDYSSDTFTNYFIVSFGNNYLYKAHSLEGPFAGQGHLPSAVKYLPMLDLISTNDLQTLPTNNIVAVYDVNGQVSPKIVAYLRVLGYDAKSMLFGANNLFYSRVLWVESLAPFAFKQEMIMNLPYVTGN
jgi:rhodanese-related sulfurtransferase